MTKINIILAIFLTILIIGASYFIKKEANIKHYTNNSYPYFLSTRYNEVNIRSGPSLDYPVIWKYLAKGLPLKIVDKSSTWLQVEDREGKKGWVYINMTTKTKTALIMQDNTNLKIAPKKEARVIAILNKNNIVRVKKCLGINLYCKVLITLPDEKRLAGWVLASQLWGSLKYK